MDQLVVVTYPEPLPVEAQQVEHPAVPEGNIALAYYFRGHLIARGVVAPEAVDAIRSILRSPVSLALAAAEDDDGNIDGRVCVVLPMGSEELFEGEDSDEGEPWKASVPKPPSEVESSYRPDADGERPQLALLPIGHVLRRAAHRKHTDVAGDAREMLENLLAGKGQDAVQKAIDDLLDSV